MIPDTDKTQTQASQPQRLKLCTKNRTLIKNPSRNNKKQTRPIRHKYKNQQRTRAETPTKYEQ